MPDLPIETHYLGRIQTDPQGDNPSATAFFGTTVTYNGRDFEAPWQSVTWPLMETGKSVTLSNGTSLTYAQVSEGVVMIAYTEKALADAAAAAAAVVPVVSGDSSTPPDPSLSGAQ